ncbi:putative beta-lactamase-like 1 [Acropora millepora]|uniref:putative beta-lactamase-like 1 n=1 Tax=Acropora millepora TaxID=45264 RepID=UPI0010FC8D34|nr:putative beta-lactamase-like 1 [Acropora millepora]
MALHGIYFSSPKLEMQYNAATSNRKGGESGITNNAFAKDRRPPSSSFVEHYSSFHDFHHATPPFVIDEKADKQTNIAYTASTAGFLPSENRKRKNKCSRTLLAILLACFIVLSVVMIALYSTKPATKTEGTYQNGRNTQTTVPFSPTGCQTIPRPVTMTELPKRLQTLLSSLEALIKQKVNSQGATAVTTNIVYRDKVIWQAQFGVMNNSDAIKRKPTADTIFPIASVTKVFTVLMLYKLYNDRFVTSLDDPVTFYQSNFFVKNPFGSSPITLRQLASHRSGFQREAPCFPHTKRNLCPYTHDQMMQRLRNLSLLQQPGKEPRYSNLGFALLGQVLGERFGNGRGFQGWMKENILSTFQMTDTIFTIDERKKQRIPVGYTSNTEFSDVQEWGWLNPTGGAFSSVEDLAKMEMGLFRDEPKSYLSEAVRDLLFAPGYIFPNGKDATGTPWETKIVDGMLIRMKVGYIYGYHSVIAIVPEMKIAFNLLCTNCGDLYGPVVYPTLSRTLLPAFKEVLRAAEQQKVLVPPDVSPYIGVFRVDGLGPLKNLEARMKNRHIHLYANGAEDTFLLNYTEPLIFQILSPSSLSCKIIFSLGVEHDLVVYDSPSPVDGLSDKFTMYSAHPSGRTYFYRVRD